MEQKLQMVEFGVVGLEEVRTLVKRWQQVLAGLAKEDEGPTMVWQTRRQVGILAKYGWVHLSRGSSGSIP